MTASGIHRALEAALEEDAIAFLLLQGPGGDIVASAGDPPPWAPAAEDLPADGERGRDGGGPDLVLDVGRCHVLHVETTRPLGDAERDRLRSLFLTAV